MSFVSRVKNIFSKKEPASYSYNYNYYTSAYRPGETSQYFVGERSIINALYARMALDVASVKIKHVKVDTQTERYEKTITDDLNDILSLRANKDQTSKEYILDICEKMFKYGYVAGIPYEFKESDPDTMVGMRTGIIKDWFPDQVLVDLYDDRNGSHKSIKFNKDEICIFVNPLYSIMNEPNSTLQRLMTKLSMLDMIDDKALSGKLDIIVSLPYLARTDVQQKQAEKRLKSIENQLVNSPYGIAYIDSSEHITQLNRPAENNLLSQIQYLTETLYNQLGVTKAIFEGTADESQMVNYYNRTIEPFLNAIIDEMNIKLLTKTARTQGQRIMFFNDMMKLSPISSTADIADKLVSKEILTRNEVRARLGYAPSDDANADKLINPNINVRADENKLINSEKEEKNQNEY